MAQVFKANQPALEREVAIKVMSPELHKEPGFSERFRREARVVARLNHPNILPVYDYGTHDKYNYLVMRYVAESVTLETLMEQPASEALLTDYLLQVAAALAYAHGHDVIHRDVKPSNILIDSQWAYLADFGLARDNQQDSRLTATGVGMGTPAYMSPEQARGISIDSRTDIYALGAILYEILTGQIPHDGPTPLAIITKRVSEPTPPPRQLNPNISPQMERAVMQALALDPNQRYKSTAEFSQSIRDALQGQDRDETAMMPPTPDPPPPAPAPQAPPMPQMIPMPIIVPGGGGIPNPGAAPPPAPKKHKSARLKKLSCPSCGGPIFDQIVPNQQFSCPHCDVKLMMQSPEGETPILCPGCQTLNPETVDYCLHCGTRLSVTCPVCYSPNRIDASHCVKCGKNMSQAKNSQSEFAQTWQQQKKERNTMLEDKKTRQRKERLRHLLVDLADPEKHEFAIYRLKQLGTEAIAGLIATMLNERDPDARYGAARALGEISQEHELNALVKSRAVKALIKALQDDDARVRYWAVDTLGKVRSKLAVEPLAPLLKDRDPDVRELTRTALARIGGDRAKELLESKSQTGFMGWFNRK